MIDPASGPYLFDTSAESWFGRFGGPPGAAWLRRHVERHKVTVSSITVAERIRGFGRVLQTDPARRGSVERLRREYLANLGVVIPLDAPAAIAAGEIMALLPDPPTPPRRSHRAVESRQERLSRWRFDILIAATALVSRIPLVHNNAADFEPIRGIVERIPSRFPTLGPLDLIRCSTLII
jgi:predicted nucleic acid-binding protein